MFDTDTSRWHPIAAVTDVPPRHVFHAQLLGREFAVWRADDDFVNVWENRCLHRGVRLSIGINDGRELKCQYHGWRYANRSAGCTYIPAHPADAPARTVANRTYPATVRYGLIWTSEAAQEPFGGIEGLSDDGNAVTLRQVAVNAPSDRVVGALTLHASMLVGLTDHAVSVSTPNPFSVLIRHAPGGEEAWYFVQPVDSNRSVIRGVVRGSTDRAGEVQRTHNLRLNGLRDRLEDALASSPPPPLLSPDLGEAPSLVGPTQGHQLRTLPVRVARKWAAADGICGFELSPIDGGLPTAQPGAHIDVHLPNGLVRQYSLINGPGEGDRYVIGVKRDVESAGGSAYLHDVVREGDALTISEPRNNFPLRRDAVRTIFLAGGIGATPLLSMALALRHQHLNFAFHYFARNDDQLAFKDRLSVLGADLHTHLGLGAGETAARLVEVLEAQPDGTHLYVCGPGPFISTVRAEAAARGWADNAVHFEYFKNDHAIDTSFAFEIALARSGMTLSVPAGMSILTVLREAGVEIPSSCETGACGTCMAAVLDGEPDHQDVYLNETERKSGALIMTCVSRSRSARLVLDL